MRVPRVCQVRVSQPQVRLRCLSAIVAVSISTHVPAAGSSCSLPTPSNWTRTACRWRIYDKLRIVAAEKLLKLKLKQFLL